MLTVIDQGDSERVLTVRIHSDRAGQGGSLQAENAE